MIFQGKIFYPFQEKFRNPLPKKIQIVFNDFMVEKIWWGFINYAPIILMIDIGYGLFKEDFQRMQASGILIVAIYSYRIFRLKLQEVTGNFEND